MVEVLIVVILGCSVFNSFLIHSEESKVKKTNCIHKQNKK